ncbi:MAG: HDOD domain-containing protein [Candidatus Delongbacteria bacterium]|nr:HDOD domain-containing protein [Candidatus Delongbacteria bacterium]MBN2834365.1 HDOD domain-containing protein [Candidatus Delongbacteria bacterium]
MDNSFENVKLFTLISQINDLPVFPEVALKIVNMVDEESTTAKMLSEAILMDTALTLKIINIANSAYYSPRSSIKNISHAIQYLGYNTIKSVAYTTAINVLKSQDENNLLVSKFQEKSIVSAYVSRLLINRINHFRKTNHNPEDFYIYGLFHDIGEIVLSIFYPEYMQDLIDKIRMGEDIVDIEGKFRHSQVGLMLMRKWNLPEIYSKICSKHHVFDGEQIDKQTEFINNVLMVADAVTYELGYNPTYCEDYDAEFRVSMIGLREYDVFGEGSIMEEVKQSIESQLTFMT